MLSDSKWSFKRQEISFSLLDWQHAMMIAGIRRGNGKYNPSRMYQGFANLSRKSARKQTP
jgi:hypothetical protein